MPEDADLLVPLTFDTGLLPESARFDAWQSALASLDVSRGGEGSFDGWAQLWMLEAMVLSHVVVDPLHYDRNEARVRLDLKDHFAVVVLVEGQFTGDYGAGEKLSGPGSVTVLDMRRACWTDATRLEAFVLSIPRAFLVSRLEECDPHGMVVDGELAAFLGSHLHLATAALPRLTRSHAQVVARTIRELLAEVLLDAHRRHATSRAREDALISRVRAYIDGHLAEPIDVPSICAALNTSRSTLYRAFGGGGGVAQQVQRRRLHAMRTLLADPMEGRSITELAAAVGFADKSHLTRVFKREYGCTPGEYRLHGAQAGDTVPVEQVPVIFDRWTTLLD